MASRPSRPRVAVCLRECYTQTQALVRADRGRWSQSTLLQNVLGHSYKLPLSDLGSSVPLRNLPTAQPPSLI